MRTMLRVVVLGATVVLVIIGGVQIAGHLNDQRLRKQSATDACVSEARSTVVDQLQAAGLPRGQLAAATAGIRFSHVGGQTTALAEVDGDNALTTSHKSRDDVLAVWEFSGYVDVPGKLPFDVRNRNVFVCNAIVFTDHSVATYGTQVEAWQAGGVIG